MQGEAVGRVALITGAGSPTGIGFAAASALGREGATLAICSTTDRIRTQAAALQGMGYEAAGFVADLVDRAQVRELVADVLARFERVDILVNNAGMVTVDDPDDDESPSFLNLTDGEWDLAIDRNLGTAFNVTRAVVPGMVERGWGRVVMVSSGPRVPPVGALSS